ncbi:hypothetical protein [Phaeobacter sp. C3_T13_0]|uniref:hypothetical protein n=1 Tax=Phaeobacter cretensis TaxID=3342641 RepID=UPI0039BD4C54
MTQVDQYKGKLGFEARHPDALSSGSAAVVSTLEEYGHCVRRFQSRSSNLVHLDCDHYRIDLRYRRHPIKPTEATTADADATEAPLRSSLSVTLVPNYPDHCDVELSELLLAVILHRLVEDLEVATVDWMHVPFTLTRAAFLGAFEEAGNPVAEATEIAETAEQETEVEAMLNIGFDMADLEADPFQQIDSQTESVIEPRAEGQAQPAPPRYAPIDAALDTPPTRVPDTPKDPVQSLVGDARPTHPARMRGKACFEPVDVTAEQLSEHCTAMLQPSEAPAIGRHAVDARKRARARATAVLNHRRGYHASVAGLGSLLAAMPQRIIAATSHALSNPQRRGNLRSHLHIICGSVALLALQSSAAIAF